MNNRYQRRGSAAYSPYISAPSKQRAISLRGLIGLLLAVLLPPVGLLFLWRNGVFRTRGRMLITALSTLEMMALCVMLTPHAELTTQSPVPAAPPSVTAAPEDETLTALYNIEQLVYEQQLAEVVAKGGTEEDLLSAEERLAQVQAQNEVIYNTIVYSVYRNAKYSHAGPICGNQTNGRELTVREAINEVLGPCSKCNPPVPVS